MSERDVRVIVKPPSAQAAAWRRRGLATVAAALCGGLAWWTWSGPAAPAPPATLQTSAAAPAAMPAALDADAQRMLAALVRETPAADVETTVREPRALHEDPNDLASYFRPGDPVPSGANLIKALHEAGVRTGIGAFNPPGTSPPLEGLAVPADFALPDGYVRHHQSTDEGVSIEPILMFAPDAQLVDANGRPIAMPADRVVPPEFAPPGLPLRRVRPGSP